MHIWNRKRLTVGKSIISDVVRGRVGKVEEQGRNASWIVLVVPVLGLLELLERDSDADEGAEHERSRQHVHVAALEARDVECNECGVEQAPAAVGEVDARLSIVARVAHHVEQDARVVAEQRIARQLREQANEDCDEETPSHARRLDEVEPAPLGHLHLGVDGLADLHDLGLDKQRVGVALGVVLGEHCSGVVVAVVRDEVPGRLGQQEDGGDLQQARADLEERRQPPCPVRRDIGRAEGDGGGQDLADEVRRVEQRRENGTLLRVAQLANQGRAVDNAEQDAHAEQHTRNNVHAHVLREALEQRTNDHDERTQHDAPAPAESLCEPGRYRHTQDRPQLVRRVDEPEQAGFDGEFALVICTTAAKV